MELSTERVQMAFVGGLAFIFMLGLLAFFGGL